MFNNIKDGGLTHEHLAKSCRDRLGLDPAQIVHGNPRDLANQMFQKAYFDRALAMYNSALHKSGCDKVEAALLYANRAAIYLELEFFEHCIHNIDLAEKDYPQEKIQKLQQRRQRCEIMMKYKDDKAKTTNPHANMFKLSYEANPKLPFFIDSLQLKEDSIFGKHLITTQELKAGDVVAVLDNPLAIRDGFIIMMCYNCLKNNNFDLHLNDRFGNSMYCSESCENSYVENCLDFESALEVSRVLSKGDHDLERLSITLNLFMRAVKHFGSVSAMKTYFDENLDKKQTVFDFDWSDPEKNSSFADFFGMMLGTETEDLSSNEFLEEMRDITTWILNHLHSDNSLKKIVFQNLCEHKEFMETVLRKIYGISEVAKSFGIVMLQEKCTFSWYIHPSMLILNHSCDPNIVFHIMNNGKIAWIVSRPIPVGGQIFTNYTPEYYSFNTPSDTCRFRETCVPCKENWRDSISLETIKKYIPMFSSSIVMNHLEFLETQVENYLEICDDLNFIHPDDGSKAEHLTKAAIMLCLFNFYLEVMECPFITVKGADYAVNMNRNTNNYAV